MYSRMVSDAQKRAMKKWQETHRDQVNEYTKKWRDNNESYKAKNCAYVQAFRSRKRVADEFHILCSIEIF